MKQFETLAITDPKKLIFGTTPHPLSFSNGMVIGGGTVYPEINFTLPPMDITKDTFKEVLSQYRQMVTGVLERARSLYVPGVVVEVELLPQTTMEPNWGVEITRQTVEIMREFENKHSLKSLLRITPNDIREMSRPPMMREGELYHNMLETFRNCALAGADMLAIESTGGKEVHDDALLNADLSSILVILGVMGVRDMRHLWLDITRIARETGTIPSGDSACGFGNTAMVLAEKGYIPRTFAAVVRVATVIRSLVAFEAGAVGPSKDCAYEGPYLKAITGYSISMEGRSAAVAHLSPLGNIAAAAADLWSNESVQNLKLLAEHAPIVSMEQLAYDCRLFNTAISHGPEDALHLRDLHVESDSPLDPQAYVLRPDIVVEIASEILKAPNHFTRTKQAARTGIRVLKDAIDKGKIKVSPRELPWLDRMEQETEELPDDVEKAWAAVRDRLDLDKIRLQDYDLS